MENHELNTSAINTEAIAAFAAAIECLSDETNIPVRRLVETMGIDALEELLSNAALRNADVEDAAYKIHQYAEFDFPLGPALRSDEEYEVVGQAIAALVNDLHPEPGAESNALFAVLCSATAESVMSPDGELHGASRTEILRQYHLEAADRQRHSSDDRCGKATDSSVGENSDSQLRRYKSIQKLAITAICLADMLRMDIGRLTGALGLGTLKEFLHAAAILHDVLSPDALAVEIYNYSPITAPLGEPTRDEAQYRLIGTTIANLVEDLRPVDGAVAQTLFLVLQSDIVGTMTRYSGVCLSGRDSILKAYKGTETAAFAMEVE